MRLFRVRFRTKLKIMLFLGSFYILAAANLLDTLMYLTLIGGFFFICFKIFYKIWKFYRLYTSGIEQVDRMSGEDFEHFLKYFFIKQGYEARVTGKTGDFGADLVISKNGETIVVQAKRYNNHPVGLSAVQEVVASIAYYSADRGMVVTNSDYSDAAIELASYNTVELIDRGKLIRMLSRLNTKKGIALKQRLHKV